VILVSRWFAARRGLAIGLALAGTSLGNALLPPFNAWLIAQTGWRTAFQWSALIPLALIPVVLFVLRERPPVPARSPGAPALEGRADPLAGLSYAEALATRNFWILAMVAMCTFYSILAVSTNLQLHLRDQGFAPQVAALGSTVLFLMGLVGKVTSGHAAETWGSKRIFVGTLGFMAAGAWFIAFAGATTIWPALFMFGLGWGGLYTLLQLLAADSFGLRRLGVILGTITVFDTAGGGLGPFLTGMMYDRFGAYRVPFVLIATLVTLALLLSLGFRMAPAGRPPAR
jgi:MFS family permease